MCRLRAYIISLNFNPGHVSHMVASYKQCEELGYESWMYVDQGFVGFFPEDFRYVVYGKSKPEGCTLALFTFPSHRNLKEILDLRRKKNCKIVYIFHEPLCQYATYRKAGFSRLKMLKLRIVNMVSALTVRWSDVILIPSKKAIGYYEANRLYKNMHYHYLPLMYDDELADESGKVERIYFSYIGTVASDHSFNEYVEFVRTVIKRDELKDVKFLIATKNRVERRGLSALLDSGRLDLVEGTPLTDRQINVFYRTSYAVWNAYERSTQSGVLAKAFMFGTPAIVLKKNLSEFVVDGREVVAINDNRDYDEIKNAIVRIVKDFDSFSALSRTRFLNTFYYRNYNQLMNDVLKK